MPSIRIARQRELIAKLERAAITANAADDLPIGYCLRSGFDLDGVVEGYSPNTGFVD
jgi:hypothetical protein